MNGRGRRAIFYRAVSVMALCVLLLSGCSTVPQMPVGETKPTTPTTEAPAPVATPFTLAYSRSDSLNPYKMNSRVNHELASLLYEGLTAPDASMGAQNALAACVSVSGKTVTAVLREDAVFSDGSAVTAADVVASFEAARGCASYTALLRVFTDAVAAEDGRTVTFTLSESEPYAAACLQFPVLRVAEDGTTLGSGKYVFDNARLVANPHASVEGIAEIRLLDLVDDDECLKGLELGNISYYYTDLSDGALPRAGGATSAVPSNYLVYVGVNADKSALKDPAVRRALSLSLDRTRLVSGAFAGYAEPACAPFPPLFMQGKQGATWSATADRDAAIAALSAAGYATPGATTEENRKPLKPLELTLLVNKGNAMREALAAQIVDQLELVGVKVTVETLEFDAYESAVKRGKFDLYLGEVRLSEAMDLFPLLNKSGKAFSGIASGDPAMAKYAAFREGAATFSEFCGEFAADLPYIPVCWRSGMAAYNRNLSNVSPAPFDAFAGLNTWVLSS